MDKKLYVSYKIAKLLKERGFPQSTSICNVVYKPNGKMSFNAKSFINPHYFFKDCYIFAPTQQMACSWLREEHKIHITTEPLEMFKEERIVYEPIIYLLNDFDDFALEYETVHLKECDTNEDAIEAALEYCLTNLI